ncbi:MAG TPA: tetratricopeptide repeat protein [Tepidisphaeraceae bacterium]|jgi:predicted O-linked N-acetylglucosamine transferase (SPINDLY family)|nr:tetratricopeptide repeat protein [Tepidisphaeraceae bacterium]
MIVPQLLEHANRHHLAGELDAARGFYERALAVEPGNASASFALGVLELQAGQFPAAIDWMRRAIAASNPVPPRFYFGLGKALVGMNRHSEAAVEFGRTLASEPRWAEVRFALGRAKQAMGDLAGALADYRKTLEIQPDFAEALNNLGNCLQMQGKLADAEAAYRRALSAKPEYAGARANLAIVVAASGKTEEAVALLQSAIGLEPASAMHYVNLAAVLCQRREFADAADAAGKATALDATSAQAAFNLGNALQGLGKLRDAVAAYQRAIAIQPDYVDAYNNLGNIHSALGEFPLAAAALDAAMAARPNNAAALNNAGCLQRKLGKMEQAEATLRRALAIDPRLAAAWSNLGNVLKDAGALDAAIACYRKAVSLDPADSVAHGNLVYSLLFQTDDGPLILAEAQRWDALHGKPLLAFSPLREHDRAPDRRLRIGYVSGDFRDHCQTLFMRPLLRSHDHAAFEIYCYSSVERTDDFTRQLMEHADVWRDARHSTDAELAAMIANDGIDILVDLAMHMATGRPGVFARKPAPIQVAWLAYPGTTGMSAIDYVLSDPRLAPPQFDGDYSEKVIRLPETFWCYDPLADKPDPNPLPALTGAPITFGCLNAPCKLTDQTIGMWAGVMRELGNSRLLLMAPLGQRRHHLLDRLGAAGISADRVSFVPFQPRSLYLQTYHQIDIGLDTYPYNGHTTSLDSYWMGVPVVSRIAPTAVGRAGLSQLTNLAMEDFAAETDEWFVHVALALASDLPHLAALRQGLRGKLQQSPLMDRARFARNIESAFRQIWLYYAGG